MHLYHLRCPDCDHFWWHENGLATECPWCGADLRRRIDVKLISEPDPKPIRNAPLNIVVVLTDEYGNRYLGTRTSDMERPVRFEYLDGDEKAFYRNRMIGWEHYDMTII